jgi:hypothetical protein
MFGKGLSFPFLINNSVILSISQSLISPHILNTLLELTDLNEVFLLGTFTKSFFS